MSSDTQALELPVEAFLRFLRVERQLSPHTIESYHHQLTAIIEIVAPAGLRDWRQP